MNNLRRYGFSLWFAAWLASWLPLLGRGTTLGRNIPALLVAALGASGFAVGVYVFLRGFRLLQRKRWIEDTPITKIAAAAIGPLKILGTATGPYGLISPMANLDCLYYKTIARNGKNAQDGTEFEEAAIETLFTPLFVEDETGRVMIRPAGAEIELPPAYDGGPDSECGRRFLRRHNLSTEVSTHVTEYVIQAGDPLLVVGSLREVVHDTRDRCLSREAADLQRLEQCQAMGISDAVTSALSFDASFELEPRTAVCATSPSVPFVLSREHPQRLVDTLARRSILYIWGGPILALLSLACCANWLGVW